MKFRRPSKNAKEDVPEVTSSSSPSKSETAGEARFRELTAKLHRERQVFIGTPIDDFIAKCVIKEILTLAHEDRRKPITLLVNSPGGYVNESLGIYDAICQCRATVGTICVGQASGMAALLVAAGAKGQRACLPEARFGLTLVSGGKENDAHLIPKLSEKVTNLFARQTGRSVVEVAQAMSSNLFLSGEEAVKFGLVDAVIKVDP